ncbi:MAG TPA: hypothetical protein VL688_01965 [Verrucomicrobiae bacterium]|nr:hypothetical protein [Verrucomicrobiae bacterium]
MRGDVLNKEAKWGTLLAAWLPAAAVAVLSLVILRNKIPNHDVLFYVYAAERLLDGTALYRDLYDHSPPFIFVFAALPVLFARAFSFSSLITYDFFVAALGFSAVLFFDRAAGPHLGYGRTMSRTFVRAGLTAVVLLLPYRDFGQKDHIVFLLSLPYIAAAIARGGGRNLSAGSLFAAGMLLAFGAAIKPFYAVLWGVTEGFFFFRGKGFRILSAQNGGLLAGVALSAAVSLPSMRDYFSMMDIHRLCYEGMKGTAGSILLKRLNGGLAVGLLAAFVPPGAPSARAKELIWLAAAAFWAGMAFQMKGWSYHYYPYVAAVSFLMVMSLADGLEGFGGTDGKWNAGMVVMAAFAVLFLSAAAAKAQNVYRVASSKYWEKETSPLLKWIEENGGKKKIFFLDTSVTPSIPILYELKSPASSAFPFLTPLRGLYTLDDFHDGHLDYRRIEDMPASERKFFDRVVRDFVSQDADTLIVRRRAFFHNGHSAPFDYLGYFSQDPDFARRLQDYHPAGQVGDFLLYRKTEAV